MDFKGGELYLHMSTYNEVNFGQRTYIFQKIKYKNSFFNQKSAQAFAHLRRCVIEILTIKEKILIAN